MRKRLMGSVLMVVIFVVGAFSLASAAPNLNMPLFEISASGSADEMQPAVAHSTASDTFLVAYEYDDHVRLRMYDSTGTPLTQTVLDFGIGTYWPALAYNDLHDEYGLTYVSEYPSYYSIMMCWVKGNAQELVDDPDPCVEVYQAPVGDILMTPAIAFNNNDTNDDFLIVWQQGNLGDWSIYGHRVTPTYPYDIPFGATRITIAETTLAPGGDESFSAPDVTYNLNMNEYLVVFEYSTSDPAHSTGSDILGRRIFNGGGGPAPLPYLQIDTSVCQQYNPTIAAYRLNTTTPYFVAYEDDFNKPTCDSVTSIRGIYLEQDGSLPPSPVYINISATYQTREANPDIIASESLGRYLVTWTKYSGSNMDIYARYLDPSSGLLGLPTLISGDSMNARGEEDYPVVAGGWPRALFVWHEDGWAGGGSSDVIGRLWGELIFLPLVIR